MPRLHPHRVTNIDVMTARCIAACPLEVDDHHMSISGFSWGGISAQGALMWQPQAAAGAAELQRVTQPQLTMFVADSTRETLGISRSCQLTALSTHTTLLL